MTRAVLGLAAVVVLMTGMCAAAPMPTPPPRPVMPRHPGSAIAVVVNGSTVNFDVPPQMYSGFVFVPLRGVFEKMGAKVAYDKSSGVISADGQGRHVELRVGNKMARVDDETLFMLQPALSLHGRTLVPLRFLSEVLGASVEWDGGQRVVRITSGGSSD